MYYAITGAAILAISALLSLFIVRSQTKHKESVVKAVLFGLYFWGFVFLQLIIAATIYSFLK